MPELFWGYLGVFLYYFYKMLSMIFIYWVSGMALGSLVSVFGKEKLNSSFASMANRELGLFGLVPAALIGIASPLCMYGTLPISAAFARKGIRDDWLAAFMVGSILLNPQLLFYTGAIGRIAVAVRFVSGFLAAIAAGLLVHFLYKNKPFFNFENFSDAQNRDTDPNIVLRFIKNLWRNLKATGPAFLIGVSLASLFETFVPAADVAGLLGSHQLFGYMIAMSIGVPLFFCGGATIPLLTMWLASGLSWGTAAIFMISGQAFKIVSLGALKVVLGFKHFLFYILFFIVFSLFSGFIVDLIFR